MHRKNCAAKSALKGNREMQKARGTKGSLRNFLILVFSVSFSFSVSAATSLNDDLMPFDICAIRFQQFFNSSIFSIGRNENNISKLIHRFDSVDDMVRTRTFATRSETSLWVPVGKSQVVDKAHVHIFKASSIKPKKTLVLIGGLDYDHFRWSQSELIKTLRNAGYEIISIELPGQGNTLLYEHLKSKKIRKHYFADDQVKILDEMLASLKAKGLIRNSEVQLLGLSWGGWLLKKMLVNIKDTDYRFLSSKKISHIFAVASGIKSSHKHIMGSKEWDRLIEFYGGTPFGWLLRELRDGSLGGGLDAAISLSGFQNLSWKDPMRFFDTLPMADPMRYSGQRALYLGIADFDALDSIPKMTTSIPLTAIRAGKDYVIPGTYYTRFRNRAKAHFGYKFNYERIERAKHDVPELHGRELANVIIRNR